MKEEIYWLVTVHFYNYDPCNTHGMDRIEMKLSSFEEAEKFFDEAERASVSRSYEFVEEYSGCSGFVDGKPKMFECRRIK